MNVIIQAGGRGSRLRHLTWNKPKCLVSVNGEPMLFQVFNSFPNAKFIVIGDYSYKTLETYIKINAQNYNVQLVKASGSGTKSGIKQALEYIPKGEGFLLLWSDIIINKVFPFDTLDKPTIFTTNEFACRWSVNNNVLEEVISHDSGIPGLFFFPNSSYIESITESGEFVRWLSGLEVDFEFKLWSGLNEIGECEHIEKENEKFSFTRFFNDVKIKEGIVIKTSKVKEYAELISREISWYERVALLGFDRIPKVLNKDPFTMTRIHGEHAFEFTDLTIREKNTVIVDILDNLKNLHKLSTTKYIEEEYKEVYIDKTIARVLSVSKLIDNLLISLL